MSKPISISIDVEKSDINTDIIVVRVNDFKTKQIREVFSLDLNMARQFQKKLEVAMEEIKKCLK